LIRKCKTVNCRRPYNLAMSRFFQTLPYMEMQLPSLLMLWFR